MTEPPDHDAATKSSVFGSDSASRRAFFFWADGSRSVALPEEGTLTIGRVPSCDVAIADESVSRVHAAIHIGAEIAVEDLGSSNGTRIMGKKLAPNVRVPITTGTLVELGHVTLVIQGNESRSQQALAAADLPPIDTSPHTMPVPPAQAASTMERLDQLVSLVARGRLSVLLLGETGVGKEVMATRIHACSPRAAGPLQKIHCAAFPESLLEAELFGYERGAFTGAVQAKAGLFEAGDGGTVFLDEVGELPLTTQAKLLRVLESHEVMRLGAVRAKKIDVRILSATNRSLEQMIAEGTFRSDLFYRLNGISLTIPPLRDRLHEIPGLVRQFVQDACNWMGAPPVPVTELALAELMSRPWAGNIRELRNVVERAVTLSAGRPIEAAHISTLMDGQASRPSGPPAGLKMEIHALERQRIIDALDRHAGNQTKAAEALGISRRTLISRIEEYDLPRPRKR